ncbi:MAG: hypothetical protein IH876_02355, partial [Gemmatimonadetes bacterium]|nr:hypothetical protein [Gemmatimonadota bacterium]
TAIAVDTVLPMLPGWTHDAVPRYEPDQGFDGKSSHQLPDLIGWDIAASGPLRLKYEGLEMLILSALGYMPKRKGGSTGGVTMPEEIVSGANKHLYEIHNRLDDEAWLSGEGGWKSGDSGFLSGQQKIRRATYAIHEAVGVSEYRSLRVNRLTLRASVTGVQLDVELVGYDRDTGSGTNTLAVLNALSLGTPPNALFSEMVVRLGLASGSTALAAGDLIKVDELELTLDNNLVIEQRDSTTGVRIVVPVRAGKLSVSGRFRLPRFEALTHRTRLGSQTELMADVKFTGGQIAATGQNYQFNIYVPSVILTTAPVPIPDAGPLAQTLEWTAHTEPSTRAGFPTNEKAGPLLIEIQNGDATHPLL